MATTTTNYGFDVPTSSDLVKNGATQIALLGQDLDTFLFRPFTKNGVINSAFDIAQRGSSISVGAGFPYTLDRWQAVRGGVVAGMTVSRQTSGLTGIQYCARIQRDSGNTSAATLQLFNAFESANTYQFAGQVVTFSFYARAGANYSGGVFSGFVGTGTGTDQNPITSVYTGNASSITVSATLNGSTWTRYQGTATLPSGTTEMYVNFVYTPTGTAGANDYVEVTGVQVEVGSQVSPFTRAGNTIQQELALCQRYYYRQTNLTGERFGSGKCDTTTAGEANINFPVTMRTKPTALEQTGTAGDYKIVNAGGSGVTCSAVPAFAISSTLIGTLSWTVAAGAVAGNATVFFATSNAYLGWSAEL
jgi:hypothetical protein